MRDYLPGSFILLSVTNVNHTRTHSRHTRRETDRHAHTQTELDAYIHVGCYYVPTLSLCLSLSFSGLSLCLISIFSSLPSHTLSALFQHPHFYHSLGELYLE